MLQRSDEPYIALVVSPLTFTLEDGRVTIIVPEEMVAEERDASGKTTFRPYVSPLTQDIIESRVEEFKRSERQSKIAGSFIDHLTVLESVLIGYYQRTGNDRFGELTNDRELGPWLTWREAVLALFDTQARSDTIKLPEYPAFPSWHRQSESFRELAVRVGYRGPFNPDVR